MHVRVCVQAVATVAQMSHTFSSTKVTVLIVDEPGEPIKQSIAHACMHASLRVRAPFTTHAADQYAPTEPGMHACMLACATRHAAPREMLLIYPVAHMCPHGMYVALHGLRGAWHRSALLHACPACMHCTGTGTGMTRMPCAHVEPCDVRDALLQALTRRTPLSASRASTGTSTRRAASSLSSSSAPPSSPPRSC